MAIEILWPFAFFLQGPDHPHCLSYKLELGSDQEIPSDWYPFATIQFGMLDTCASGTEVRSLGVESDFQPQKHVHQRAYFNIQVYPKALWFKWRLLELWPDLALDISFALLNDRVYMYMYVCLFDLLKSPVLETWWSSVSQISLSSRKCQELEHTVPLNSALDEKQGIKNKFTFQKHLYNKNYVRIAFVKMCSMEHI